MPRMLGAAGKRCIFISRRRNPGRCGCRECAVTPERHQQRAREKRLWEREARATAIQDA